ncbi:signal recognition particle protein [Candidatus Palibaumannia cicadellinicola]|uniref:Signal recognition particle protein n=1 Tax=Baumannia cicadellinicola subsp. Homalodisca coagulata TaxID=374463 RepID=Q1LTQ8_BAUCH|nr:signal recognition particle protein [Candidatus Baumannia cicadellinicola]ABF14064.1 signal recognition particle protein [Baumannia cicadellinicola str. Hc (Homalodisca coagulata)]MBS0032926.1 signal recognition particle protein [Candidatus Baumannia cicadellinicola]MCJ7462360.1 signal recognition particle protein [Candidatus Baumannia cicadellinicola]MCJ7462677.1 signal recognition particle protein [Candidatus Baumannia cicadellinicola]
MFEYLSEKLSFSLRNISDQGRITEVNIKDTLREVRMALLEADVALPVIQEFISRVKESALSQKVNKSLTPGQEFIKIIRWELINTMGGQNDTLNLAAPPPVVVLIVGQQGVGKTTSVVKLGKYLGERQRKKILVVSTDVYRPSAINQLETLTKNINIDFFPSEIVQKPLNIVHLALTYAKQHFYDVLLVDTAGRLHTNNFMMNEIINIHIAIKPVETIFVVDAMTGQDAAKVAKSFNSMLPLTGIILTKVDGTSRCGAALSISYITGKPIKFLGVGEKIDALEPFYPDRLANRILGMGDTLSLIEQIERNVDYTQAQKLTKKIKQGNSFDLTDFLHQMKQIRKIGGITGMMNQLPGINKLPDSVKLQMQNDKLLVHMEAIIYSMTAQERVNPEIIKGSRKRRIAAGSGMQVQDVNRMLKQFTEMQRIMNKIQKDGIMRSLKKIIPHRFF